MSIRRDAAWSALTAVTVSGARFLLIAILARRLDSSALGQYAYVQWLIDICYTLCSFGINGAMSRYLAEYRTRQALFCAFLRTFFPIASCLPFLGAIAAIIAVIPSELRLSDATVLAMFCWAILNGLWAMQTAILTGLQRFDLIGTANLGASLVVLLGALFAPMQANDLFPAFSVMSLSSLLGLAVGMPAVINAIRSPNCSRLARQTSVEMSAVYRYSLNIWVTGLLWSLVWSRGELPLVKAFLGDASVAGYAVALTLFGGAIAGVMLGLSGMAPHVTRLYGDGNVAEAAALCRKVGQWQLVTCGSLSATLILLAPELLHYAFGGRYPDSRQPLSLLALGLPAMALAMHNHLLQIATDARFNRNSTLLGLVVLAIAAVVSIPFFGTSGAAAARVLAMAVLSLAGLIVFGRRFRTSSFGARNLAVLAMVLAVSMTLVHSFPETTIIVRVPVLGVLLGALVIGIRNDRREPVVWHAIQAMRGR